MIEQSNTCEKIDWIFLFGGNIKLNNNRRINI